MAAAWLWGREPALPFSGYGARLDRRPDPA